MIIAPAYWNCQVQYSVKNTFIEVKVAEKKPFRASSAPPAARFAQVTCSFSPLGRYCSHLGCLSPSPQSAHGHRIEKADS